MGSACLTCFSFCKETRPKSADNNDVHIRVAGRAEERGRRGPTLFSQSSAPNRPTAASQMLKTGLGGRICPTPASMPSFPFLFLALFFPVSCCLESGRHGSLKGWHVASNPGNTQLNIGVACMWGDMGVARRGLHCPERGCTSPGRGIWVVAGFLLHN